MIFLFVLLVKHTKTWGSNLWCAYFLPPPIHDTPTKKETNHLLG